MFIAYKKGLVKLKGDNVLHHLIWALKFNGCAISNQEIDELVKMGKKN